MFRRVSALLPLRPPSRVPLPSGSPQASAAAVLPLAAAPGTVRTKNIQRYFGTSNVINSKEDEKSCPTDKISREPSESQDSVSEHKKKDLLNIIKGMKVELSTVNVQTTKPPSRKARQSVEAVMGRRRRAARDEPEKRNEPLSPALEAAVSAVAASLPFDKQVTKSDLLRQLQQHEQSSVSQKEGEKRKISFSNIISDMKVAKSTRTRTSRPEHQIQFDEGFNSSLEQELSADFKKSLKNLFKGKRLNIFDVKQLNEEAPLTETSLSLWDVEFAKQLALVKEQPFQNGLEEMIQWTKEGKLWEFPIDNEAGFDDDGSEFHEHIFLDKYLEDFPKQGPIRHFMELVTCGLSKNPYLSVKQKVEHIEWFRNYFKEKGDILKENNIQLN
ncbi:PREDICTED: 28S ribosomal protein S31, mitochondrial [Chinchilla lanigera]|uniref:Small ribosomal subunit protein mS31 n=1 Tax=Chinchilla lanigera TaxID=34839 RepID=A0A8C2UQZ6_CHILA|nr:PREDICTED: 28S ribosomal protein S31, mitochondrial [Chinchilla lanigera]